MCAFAHCLALSLRTVSPAQRDAQTPIVLGIVAWAISWLGSFKVAALILGTSDLASEPDLPIFAFCFLMPVLLTPEAARGGATWLDKLAQFAATTLVAAVASLGIFTPLLLAITTGDWQPRTGGSLAIHCAPSVLHK